MYNCEYCFKSFEKRHSFIGHMRIHSQKVIDKINKNQKLKAKIISNGRKYKCQYCGIEIFNKNPGGHIASCKLNPKFEEILENRKNANKLRIYKHSDESKKKLSDNKIKYLLNNPDRVPYILNHSSKISFPELVFENGLIDNNIFGWSKQYRIGLYSFDFAFINLKIDVEVDGSTHKQEKVKKIDKQRDEFSINNGWIVIRFEAELVKKNIIECISILKGIINERTANINSLSRTLKYNYSSSQTGYGTVF